ncbi:TetR/AcrR family transcriptional regulator [Streptomyces sp. NPDC057623]|uniref:TetR/AcrR family transcriptional regulator n=1 Tax=Streptomyces sp. NPDC057623 TaxID=3346187 RepID=UPI003681425B
MSDNAVTTERSAGTREAIMAAAERLYAEHGLAAVSNRQICEASGQGNVAAVGYHFGGKSGLVRAIMRGNAGTIELVRARMLDEMDAGPAAPEVRDWVACLVRPVTEHLDSLGVPSWHARFSALVMTDPVLRALVADEALVREPLRRALRGLGRCLDFLPAEVRAERGRMAGLLITHTCAEQERALADGTGARPPSWEATATALTDALTGLFLAPTTPGQPCAAPPNRPNSPSSTTRCPSPDEPAPRGLRTMRA